MLIQWMPSFNRWITSRKVLAIFSSIFTALVFVVGFGASQGIAKGNYGKWNIELNATSHASVLGLMSGFVAATIVLFLTRADDEAYESECKQHTVGIFVVAFLHCVLAAFLYASFAGYPKNPDIRTPIIYQYLFDLAAIEYLFAVFLTFLGLASLVRILNMKLIEGMTRFIVEFIYWLGIFFVFADFFTSWQGAVYPQWCLLFSAIFVSGSRLYALKPLPDTIKPFSILEASLMLSIYAAIAQVGLVGWISTSEPKLFEKFQHSWFGMTICLSAIVLGSFFSGIYRYRDSMEK